MTRHVMGIVLLVLHDRLWRWEQLLSCVTDEGTEAQRGEVPCSGHPASQVMPGLG